MFGNALHIGCAFGLAASVAATGMLAAAPAASAGPVPTGTPSPPSGCQLDPAHGNIKHVIQIGWDNTHFNRDNPNVPSDLEQLPAVQNFITGNGSLLVNYHTPLISHTATDFLTGYTGVYGDRHGIPVSNSFASFNSNGTQTGASAFSYWTDPLNSFGAATDKTPQMIDRAGVTAPAPWVPFTRAGCAVGNVATANMVLENTGLDIAKVFGSGSPETMDANKSGNFVGVAVHCAQGDTCATNPNTRADLLPDEPGGYSGYNALYGHKYVAPYIGGTGTGGAMINDVYNGGAGGQAITQFPGFDGMTAATSLGYVAAMQEHNVPVTYAYLSDAHDCHGSNCGSVGAYGPGEPGYETYLQQENASFAQFFSRLKADGIDKSNTLFVFGSDESDRVGVYSGVTGAPPTDAPTPAGCEGVNTPCSYTHAVETAPTTGQLGEVSVNLANALPPTSQAALSSSYVHNDSAPNFWLLNNPGPGDPVTQTLEKDLLATKITNPYTGRQENLTNYLADQNEQKILHMVTADPARTPTLTDFAKPWDYVAKANNCAKSSPLVACSDSGFAYIHGDYDPQPVSDRPSVTAMSANNTWLGMVGPGVANVTDNADGIHGVDARLFADEVDARPTLMQLTGLTDDYQHDGRVMAKILTRAYKTAPERNDSNVAALGRMLKQLDAAATPGFDRAQGSGQPEGFAGNTLVAFTNAVPGGTNTIDSQLSALGSQRDIVASDMQSLLDGAEFSGATPDVQRTGTDLSNGQCLLNAAHALAVGQAPVACSVLPGPVLPESPLGTVLPALLGAAVLGGGLVLLRRRQIRPMAEPR